MTIGFRLLITVPIGLASAQALGQDATPPPTSQSAAPATEAPASQPAMTTSQMLAYAEEMRAAGEYNGAGQIVSAIIQQDPKNLDALSLAGELLIIAGDVQSAIRSFQKARSVKENDFRSNLGLGKAYFRAKLFRNAVMYLETAALVTPPDRIGEVYTVLAESQRGAGNVSRAIEAIDRALKADPDNVAANTFQIQLKLERSEISEALALTDRLLAVVKKSLDDSKNKQEALKRIADAYDLRLMAIQELERSMHVKDPQGRVTDQVIPGREAEAAAAVLAYVDTSLQRSELAITISYFQPIELLRESLKYDPTNVKIMLRAAVLLRNTFQDNLAVEVYQRVLTIEPANAEAKAALSELGAPEKPAASTAPATQPSGSMLTSQPVIP